MHRRALEEGPGESFLFPKEGRKEGEGRSDRRELSRGMEGQVWVEGPVFCLEKGWGFLAELRAVSRCCGTVRLQWLHSDKA